MKEIKFENEVLVSTYDGDTLFHDDFLGESIWIMLDRKPPYIKSYDYREFNGKKIKAVAKELKRCNDIMVNADLKMLARTNLKERK